MSRSVVYGDQPESPYAHWAKLAPNPPASPWCVVEVWCQPAAKFADPFEAERYADEQRSAGKLGVRVVDDRGER